MIAVLICYSLYILSEKKEKKNIRRLSSEVFIYTGYALLFLCFFLSSCVYRTLIKTMNS